MYLVGERGNETKKVLIHVETTPTYKGDRYKDARSVINSIGDLKHSILNINHEGWLLCNGQEVLKSQYNRLYQIIGNTFGVASNADYFKLPDARGRVCSYIGQGNGLTNRTNGQTIGSETTTLTQNELPSHNHTASSSNNGSHNHSGNTGNSGNHTHSGSISSSGLHAHTGTTDSDGSHTHSLNMVEQDDGNFSNQPGQYPTGDADKLNGSDHYISTESNGTHSHSFTTSNSGDHQHNLTIDAVADHLHNISNDGSHNHTITVENTGSGNVFSNMQPTLFIGNLFIYSDELND